MLVVASGGGKWLHVSSLTWWRLFLFSVCSGGTQEKENKQVGSCAKTLSDFWRAAHLELHGDVLLVLRLAVAALVVGQVVGSTGVDDGRLGRRPTQVVAVGEGQRWQQAGCQEGGQAHGDQLEQGERWRTDVGREGRNRTGTVFGYRAENQDVPRANPSFYFFILLV